MIPRVLIVAGSDSSGGAGIQADLKTVSVLGAYGMTAITALTAQNTCGVEGVVEVDPEFVVRQIEACVNDIGCDAVKTGMLANAAIVEAVAEAFEELGIEPIVVDPVMVAKSGASLLKDDAIEAVRNRLLPLAAVVTPNLPEAERLTGRRIQDLGAMRDAARAIADLGARAVVVKGGHLADDATDVLYDGLSFTELPALRIDTPDSHGTGCIFSSAIAAGLAAGEELAPAVAQAKELVTAAIGAGLPLGDGHGPADPMAWAALRKS